MLTSLRPLLHRRLPSISRLPQIDQSRVSAPVNLFSTSGFGRDDGNDAWDKAWNGGDLPSDPTSGLDWGDVSSWSTGLTKDHFDGEAIGRPVDQDPQSQPQLQSEPPRTSAREMAIAIDEEDEMARMLDNDNKENKRFVDGWHDRMVETYKLLKQVREPGARGEYLRDSEKTEMYRLHKDPAVYNVEKLSKDYRVMRQRVHAILWLKEMEEEEEEKLGKPLDDSVEILLDNFPEFFNSHDREFHVASLSYKPDFKVMPEGWDGSTRDPDEVLYKISMKEDQRLYEEFVQRLNFNKKKVAGEVKCHKYSRRRPTEGWNFTVEKLGPRDKRGGSGGWKFVSLPDGSSRALNEMEKMLSKTQALKKCVWPTLVAFERLTDILDRIYLTEYSVVKN